MRDEREDWLYDDGSPDAETPAYWHPGEHLPEDARKIGLTHHVPDGALLEFAGSLDGAKLHHRVTAWLLLVLFGLPVFFYVLRIFFAFT